MRRRLTACPVLFIIASSTSVASAQRLAEPAPEPVDPSPPAPPPAPPHRVWREVNHGLRHGPSMELIEVGGGDGRLILIGDDHGYVYRSTTGGQTWSESRLSPDEDVLFPIPLPRLDEMVLPNIQLFDQSPRVRAQGIGPPPVRPGDEAEEHEEEGRGGAERSGGGLQPRDRGEDPGDLLAAFAHGDPSPWMNWITTCETDDDRAYAATDEGLYRSNDGGLTWYRVFVGANHYEDRVRSVLCGEHDADVVYIGTEAGIFWSRNGGAAWVRPRSFVGGYSTCYLEFDAAHEGSILVGTTAGAYVTANLEDFETVYFPEIGSAASREVCSIAAAGENVYLGSGDGAVVSHDGGDTFEPLAPGFLDRSYIGMVLADPRDDAHVYILTDDVFWESRDAGRTVVPLLTRAAIEPLKTFALDPNDPDRVLLLTGKQLLVLEPERPRPPPSETDPVARAARRALRTSPAPGPLVDGILERMHLDDATVIGLREAARTRNLLPQVSLVAGIASAIGDRSMTGLGYTGAVDDFYEPASCRLSVRPSACWISGQRRDLAVTDRSEPFVWGVGVLFRWNLSLATFDRAEASSIWQDVTHMRQRVMHTVADYWFERERVLTELATSAHGADETRQLTLRAAEMTAALDAMSGGMFSRPMTRRR